MNSEKVMGWLQVIGNFGLLAGLILVAIQIQQNTEITKAQMVSDGRAMGMALKLAVIGDDAASAVAKSIDAPETLTTKDLVVLDELQFANYYHKSRDEFVYSLGYGIDYSTMSVPEGNARATAGQYLSSRYGLAWWEQVKDAFWMEGAPETRNEIEAVIDERRSNPDFFTYDRFASIRAALISNNNEHP